VLLRLLLVLLRLLLLLLRLLLLLLLEVPRPARAARGGLETGSGGGERDVLFSTSFKYRNGKKNCILFHLVSVGNIKAKEDSVVYKG